MATAAPTSACAIAAGGGIGSSFGDSQATAPWDRISAAASAALRDRLLAQHCRVVELPVPTPRTRKAEQAVHAVMAAHRRNRPLQVSHRLDEDAAGRRLRCDIALLRVAPKDDARSGARGPQRPPGAAR